MREEYSEERRQQVRSINKGKNIYEKTRELIRKAALTRPPMSIESRMKCAVNTRPITITNIYGTNPQYFVSIIKASSSISCSPKTIQRALNSTGVIKGKYQVTYTINNK